MSSSPPPAPPVLELVPAEAEIDVGEDVSFSLLADGRPALAERWERVPAVGRMDGGLYVGDSEPRVPLVTVTAYLRGAKVEARLRIVPRWRRGWPLLMDGPEGVWSDGTGQRTALLLYDVLRRLPTRAVEHLDEIRIYRKKTVELFWQERAGLLTPIPKLLPFLGGFWIDIPTPTLDKIDPTQDVLGPYDYGSIYLLLHELGHAAMFHRLGGEWFAWLDQLLQGVKAMLALSGEAGVLRDLMGAGLALVGWPLGAAAMLGCVPLYLVERHLMHDFVSDFGLAASWATHDVSLAASVPILGALLWRFLSEPPNVVTGASLPGNPFGLRNERVKADLQDTTYFSYDAAGEKRLVDALNAFGPVSRYAASSAVEDFAESFATCILGTAQIRRGKVAFNTGADLNLSAFADKLDDARRRFFTDAGLFAASWTEAGLAPGIDTTVSTWRTLPPAGAPDTPVWKVDTRVPQMLEKAADEPARRDPAALRAFVERWARWEEEGRLLRRNREILQGLERPMREPHALEFLRAAELHGDGLRLYLGGSVPAAVGDLLLARDQELWMATAVDGDGRISEMAGGVVPGPAPRAADFVIERKRLPYHWSPARTRRRFVSEGAPASPHWADLEEGLARLVGLWGRDESPATRRALHTAGGFLAEVLDAAGLSAEEFPLPKEPTWRDVVAYCEVHGEGLAPFEPGRTRVAVGDVLLLYDRNSLGVVTRATPDAQPLDVLVGGADDEGLAQEGRTAVKLRHGLDAAALPPGMTPRERLAHFEPRDAHFVWRPSREPRRFTREGGAVSDVFDDLDRALNHLLDHVGAGSLRRGEREYHVAVSGVLPLALGLMLERGATPEARRALARLELGAADEAQVENFLHRHGEARAQAPAQPGDVVGWREGRRARWGVVLSAEDGEPTRTLTGEDVLRTHDVRLPRAALETVWTPARTPRRLPADDPATAFYGEPSALFALVDRRAPGSPRGEERQRVGGETYLLSYSAPADVARLLALGAPAWVRGRLFEAEDLDALRERCATLGVGLRDDAPDAPLPPGTWLFLGRGDFGVVLTTTPEGLPGTMLTHGPGSLDLRPVPHAERRAYWRPAATPFAYTGAAAGEAYADLDAFVGLLRVRGLERASRSQPLFKDPELLRSGVWRADLVKVLRRGPDAAEEWPAYLTGFGQGLVEGDGARPGDFLLLRQDRQALALDADEMLLWNGDAWRLGPRRGVTRVWRPSARPRP